MNQSESPGLAGAEGGFAFYTYIIDNPWTNIDWASYRGALTRQG